MGSVRIRQHYRWAMVCTENAQKRFKILSDRRLTTEPVRQIRHDISHHRDGCHILRHFSWVDLVHSVSRGVVDCEVVRTVNVE